jgi:autotransporter strand-loop-strand O-heptosyltransferase
MNDQAASRVEPPAPASPAPAAVPSALEERDPAAVPTQVGPQGLRFDYNDGCRVLLPKAEQPWRVRLTDLDTSSVLYDAQVVSGQVRSMRRHYLRIRLEVWAGHHAEPVLRHDYAAADRPVLIQFPAGTLGDTLGWFPYAEKFQQQHGCRLTVAIRPRFIALFRDAYPDIRFVTAAEVRPEEYYATYKIMLYYNDDEHRHQPSDYQLLGLHEAAAYLLGVDPAEARPRLVLPDTSRPAVQSTAQTKHWNNPQGWREVVAFLTAAGYRVICIDQKAVTGLGLTWTHIPFGAEDQTGDLPLAERARWLLHADFFIGLSSGLSWLAWAVGTPVVLISGFTHPITEFATPYRVINYHVCNSCWNDVRLRFDNRDYFWCPRHKDTPRQFECSRMITAGQVIDTIKRIPGFSVAATQAAGAAREQPIAGAG